MQLQTAIPAIFSTTSGLFFLILTLLLWISDPQDYLDYMPWESALFLWASGIALMVLTYTAILTVWASFPEARRIAIPILFAGLPAFVMATAYHRFVGGILSDGAWVQNLWPSHFYMLLIQLAFEAMYLRYGLPKSFQDLAARRDEAEPPLPAPIADIPAPPEPAHSSVIALPGETPIRLADILLVRAQEHYIEVHTARGEPKIIRARIADFLAQVNDDHGIQPHRSWWVSVHAAKALVTENGKRFLALHSGLKIPVSRARLGDVQSWLDEL
ncbi:LytTR family transcriptional regulator [Donghicola sp. C2-DW-16]|uniref:LytTR family transcriptional regulator n=1 Tax=Donghicola mangrovi TaxID=2729614 RepID=A0ABX2PCS6_9RHOB|nr:LytTR family transcriptional regulator [Donghicola mangrovi]